MHSKWHMKVSFPSRGREKQSRGAVEFCSLLIVLCLKLSPDLSGEPPAT